MESILTNIKKLLGYSEEDTSFDVDITIHINATFARLNGLGVGPEKVFVITDKDNKWSEFIGTEEWMEPVKTYMYLKVKIIHDPPLSSIVLDSIKSAIAELEWTLKEKAEEVKLAKLNSSVV